MAPFLEELRRLQNGVPAYDAHTDSDFLLKAYLVLVTGDTPAITKILKLTGHVAKCPCRACKLEGRPFEFFYTKTKDNQEQVRVKSTRYYYPPGAALLRTSESYQEDGRASLDNSDLATHSGVKGISPLVSLATISIPDCCPFDIMHLVYLGFVRDLCALLNGTFFKVPIHLDGIKMSAESWKQLGTDMEKIEAPVAWGRYQSIICLLICRYPRNIAVHIKGFKAEELGTFLIRYLLPLSFQRVSTTTFRALQRLVFVISKAISFEISYEEMVQMDEQLKLFLDWFYTSIYGGNNTRLPACKYTVHALSHLIKNVRDWGSASYFWQFTEVLCHCR